MLSARVIRKNARNYPAMVQQAADKFLPMAGAAVRSQAVELAPEVTGNLKGSITWRVEGASAIVGTNVDYAQHVEYGAKQKTRQSVRGYYGYKPFLRPSIDLLRKKLTNMFAGIVRGIARGRA